MIVSNSKYPQEDNDKYNKYLGIFDHHVFSSMSRLILSQLFCEQFYLYSMRRVTKQSIDTISYLTPN